MKKVAKKEITKEGPAASPRKTVTAASRDLKTDFPLCEKDEVKQAEANMQKSRRDIL